MSYHNAPIGGLAYLMGEVLWNNLDNSPIGYGFWGLFCNRLMVVSQAILDNERDIQREDRNGSENDRDLEKEFTDLLQSSEFIKQLKLKYRAWATMCRLIEQQTLAFYSDFVSHWQSDRDTLVLSFSLSELEITSIRPLSAALHCDGRQTLCVRFANGASLVYKPRSVQIDYEFQAYLKLLNEELSIPYFRTLRISPHGDHGWIEYIETCELKDHLARSHYEKAGALLAVIYALSGTGFYHENLWATAQGPVLVNLEGMLEARLNSTRADSTCILSSGPLPFPFWEALGIRKSLSHCATSLIDGFKRLYLVQMNKLERLSNSVSITGLDRISKRMNHEDLERQLWLIRLSLECHQKTHDQVPHSNESWLHSPTLNGAIEEIRRRLKALVITQGMSEPLVVYPIRRQDGTWVIRKIDIEHPEYQLFVQTLTSSNAIKLQPVNEHWSRWQEDIKKIKSTKQLHELLLDTFPYDGLAPMDVSFSKGLSGFVYQVLRFNSEPKIKEAVLGLLLQALRTPFHRFGHGFRTELVDFNHGWAGVLFVLVSAQQQGKTNVKLGQCKRART